MGGLQWWHLLILGFLLLIVVAVVLGIIALTSRKRATGRPPGGHPEPAASPRWAADPGGRYELRYWDGGRWTEHVSTRGERFVDPVG